MKHTSNEQILGTFGFVVACVVGAGLTLASESVTMALPEPVLIYESRQPTTDNSFTLPAVRTGLTLSITTAVVSVRAGEWVPLGAVIRNECSSAVLLVQPGDGSREGRRTPMVKWSIDQVGERGATSPDDARSGGCGNLSGLRFEDVVRLVPGQEMALNDYGYLQAPAAPGRYRVRLTYTNNPSQPWGGIGDDESPTMARLRRSTACQLVSNDIILTVVK